MDINLRYCEVLGLLVSCQCSTQVADTLCLNWLGHLNLWPAIERLIAKMMHYPYYLLLVVLGASSHTIAAPPGFPTSGNGLWYAEPGTIWSRHYLPVGNGFLAAMTPGGTTQELTQLNIESLWSGGPQADPVCQL